MRACKIAVLLLLAAACAPSRRAPWPQVKNIVFISVDTLRADHTSAYGYPVATTPFLEEMAAKGITFDRAYSHSSTTAPSHASMFTGLYPIQHRVQTNGQQLDERFSTLAGLLREAGWRTAGVVSVPALFEGSMVGRGFGEFFGSPEGANNPGRKSRPANETIDVAARWLRRSLRQEAPFFLWVHLYDPHGPLRPPTQHLRAIRPRGAEADEKRREMLRSRHIEVGPAVHKKILKYDASIRFADEEVSRLYGVARDNGALSDTLWVITSDHGKGLKTHNDWFGHHVQIYNTQLHVPLMFIFPGDWEAGRRVSGQLASHVDLVPTLLEIIGMEPMEQAAPIQGLSLTTLFDQDEPVWERLAVFSERRIRLRRRPAKRGHEPGTRQSVQTLTRKYLLFSEGPDEYYHLDVDPYEQNDLIAEADSEALRLRSLIVAMVDTLALDFVPGQVSEEDLRQLRALGYVR